MQKANPFVYNICKCVEVKDKFKYFANLLSQYLLLTMFFEYVGHQDEIATKNYNVEQDDVDFTKTNLESRIKGVQDILASKKNLDFKTLNDLEEAIDSFLK